MNVIIAAIQAFILLFIVFCRSQAFWQVLAILAIALLALKLPDIWRALPRPILWSVTAKRIALATWPALVLIFGSAVFSVYSSLAPDHRFYKSESRSHAFWHTLYAGLISTDPELTSRYGYGEETYTDTMGYMAALHDLRGRNEAPPEFAEVVDGVITINIIKDTGAYDRVIRRIVFQVVAEHPWLVLRSLLIGKPSDQLEILGHVAPLRDMRAYLEVLACGFAASLLAVLAGAGTPHGRQWIHWTIAILLLVICSWITMLIVPSAIIPDVIVFYLMLALLFATYLPFALVWQSVTGPSSPRENMLAQGNIAPAPEIQRSRRNQQPTTVT